MRLVLDDITSLVWNDDRADVTYSLNHVFPNPNEVYPYYGMLPPVVKYMSPKMNNGMAYVLIEGRPMTINMRWYPCLAYQISEYRNASLVHTINIPWHQWLLGFKCNDNETKSLNLQSAALYFSQTELQSTDHVFYPPYLLNGWANSRLDIVTNAASPLAPRICADVFSSVESIDLVGDYGLQDLYEDITKLFWGGFFNLDANNALSAYQFTSGTNDTSFTVKQIKNFYDNLSKKSMREVHDMLTTSHTRYRFAEMIEYFSQEVAQFDIATAFMKTS